MLNNDVISVIKSFAGITSLDVADAVRELRREGIRIGQFKIRQLSQLCFIIHHKYKKKKTTLLWNQLRFEIGNHFEFGLLPLNLYLLAFKLLGYAYEINDPMASPQTFCIHGCAKSNTKWCKILKKLMWENHDTHVLKLSLVSGLPAMAYFKDERYKQKIEKRVLQPLF